MFLLSYLVRPLYFRSEVSWCFCVAKLRCSSLWTSVLWFSIFWCILWILTSHERKLHLKFWKCIILLSWFCLYLGRTMKHVSNRGKSLGNVSEVLKVKSCLVFNGFIKLYGCFEFAFTTICSCLPHAAPYVFHLLHFWNSVNNLLTTCLPLVNPHWQKEKFELPRELPPPLEANGEDYPGASR